MIIKSVSCPFFPSDMLHGVPKNTTGDMRISMAIDVHTGDEVLLNAVVSQMPKRLFLHKVVRA